MPNCIALTNKHDRDPAPFYEVDDLMRKALGVEPDPDKYLRSWYDILGMQLACGRSLDFLLGYYWFDPIYGPIVNFLHQHYTCEAWYEPR